MQKTTGTLMVSVAMLVAASAGGAEAESEEIPSWCDDIIGEEIDQVLAQIFPGDYSSTSDHERGCTNQAYSHINPGGFDGSECRVEYSMGVDQIAAFEYNYGWSIIVDGTEAVGETYTRSSNGFHIVTSIFTLFDGESAIFKAFTENQDPELKKLDDNAYATTSASCSS